MVPEGSAAVNLARTAEDVGCSVKAAAMVSPKPVPAAGAAADPAAVTAMLTSLFTRAAIVVAELVNEEIAAIVTFEFPNAACEGAVPKTPKPKAATVTSAMRLKVVFVDICFLSISRVREFPDLGFG